jgi:sec-independent protein translocase protein TatB
MFDIGWSELFMIGVVAVLAIGPKEIPEVMKNAARVLRRLQYVRFALSQQFEDIMKESGVDDLRKSVNFEEKSFDEAAVDEEPEEQAKDIRAVNE